MRAPLIALSALLPATALAWPQPNDWLPIEQNGVAMVDPLSDHRHDDVSLGDHLDFVGDSNDLVFQWWADMNVLYLRLRLNESPWSGSTQTQLQEGSWGIAFEIDGDTSTLEYAITQNGPTSSVNLWEIDFNQPGVDANLSFMAQLSSSQAASTTSQASSALGGDTDWLLDLKISWSLLQNQLGINPEDGFGIVGMSADGFFSSNFSVDLIGFDDSNGLGGVADGLSDDIAWDSDGDQLSNAIELNIGTDPFDADSDDDGLDDHLEAMGLATDPLACDTDGDLLSDGLEAGVPSASADTDESAGCFVADADPGTVSEPLFADTDFGGVADGVEDWNFNGKQDAFEGDLNEPFDDGDEDSDGVPNFAEDDCPDDSGNIDDADSDADGLDDSVEGWADTDGDGFPDFCDTDSDGDGIPDADEGTDDSDGDGIPNYQDIDSDDDGIPDADESPVGDSDCDGIPDVLDQTNDDMCESNTDSGLPGNFGDLTGGAFSGGACSSSGSPGGFLPLFLALGVVGMRRKKAWLALLLPGVAAADGLEQDGDSLPVNAQRFHNATDSVFFTIEDAHVGPAAQGGAQMVFNHAANPLVYRFEEPGKSDYPLLGSVSTAEITGWFNLPSIRIGAVLPVHVASSGHEVDGFRLLGDVRLLSTWMAIKSDSFNLASTLDLSLPTGNEETWLGDASSVSELSVQAAWKSPKVLAVGHLGYRVYFDKVPLGDTNWGNRGTAGLGLAYSLSDAATITWENTAEFLSRSQANAKEGHNAPFETLGGFRYSIREDLEASVGAGAGLTEGVGSPDWRVALGLHWNRSSPFTFSSAEVLPIGEAPVPTLPETTPEPEPAVPLGWIRVIASNEAGLPVACSVRVLGTGKPPVAGGEDGWTELQLPAGKHEVVVWSEGYQSFHTNIDVVEEGKTDIEVTLPGGKVAIEGDEIRVFEKIFFELDSTEIKRESFGILDEVVELLLNHPEIIVMSIEGHTDDQGDAQYNVDLSFGRAEAVVHYFTAQGIERERLQARGHGESNPILQGESDESRAANRRVEFHIRERLPEIP